MEKTNPFIRFADYRGKVAHPESPRGGVGNEHRTPKIMAIFNRPTKMSGLPVDDMMAELGRGGFQTRPLGNTGFQKALVGQDPRDPASSIVMYSPTA